MALRVKDSLAELARRKALPLQFLLDLGLVALPAGGVAVPYYGVDRQELLVRTRDVPGRPRFDQPRGSKLQLYGLWRLDDARAEGCLHLVEGESDCWAIWHHGLPALGVPGSSAYGLLTAEVLDGIGCLYVHREPGQSGDVFSAGVAKRLAAIGFDGESWELRLPVKDACDLHAQDPPGFRTALEEAVRAAIPLEARSPAIAKAQPAEPEIPEPPPWPDPPSELAYHGLAGEIVRLIEPQTEADPVAILAQILVMFGNAIGRTAHWRTDDTLHYGNLYCCLVGETATARKGTSKGRALKAFTALSADDGWHRRIMSGLSTGEGLISTVRDPTHKTHHIKSKGRVIDTQQILDDPGETDKRLMLVEPEFGRVFRAMEREGNTLSPVLRLAWDGEALASLTKGAATARLRATGAHVSLVGHITPAELHALMSEVEAVNGLANRFLWVACRYSKMLPLGGQPVDLGDRRRRVAEAIEEAKDLREVPFDARAAELWQHQLYAGLFHRPAGVFGAVTNRAVAQVRRLALLYALLDRGAAVSELHLRAAVALWGYCERTARWLFGDSTGNNMADDILAAIRSAGAQGMTGKDIRQLVGNHARGEEISRALAVLLEPKLIRSEKVSTAGRAGTRYFSGDLRDLRDLSGVPTTYVNGNAGPSGI